MNKLLLVFAAVTVSLGCGTSISDQCMEIARAQCAWAYRCPNAGYTYIDRGTSEEDCVARFGFSGAPGPGCENVTSEAQACSAPKKWQGAQVAPCVDEMGAAACTSSGPMAGSACSSLCQ